MLDQETSPPAWTWLGFLVVCVLILFKLPLTSSLWLDETVTAWVISGSFSELIGKVFGYQGQSPFYYILLKCLTSAFGKEELFLRLPSIIAAAISLFVFWKIGKTLFNSWTAWFATILLLGSDGFLVSAVSARPYALAFLFSVSATLVFLSLLDRPHSFIKWFFYSVFVFCMLASHYLFFGLLIIHLIFALSRKLNSKEIRPYAILPLISLTIAIIVGLYQFKILGARADLFSFSAMPTTGDWALAILPLTLIIYVVCALLISVINGARPSMSANPSMLVLCLIWAILGPTIFWLTSISSGRSIWVDRYWLWSLPGACLFLAAICTTFNARRIPAVCVLALILWRESGRTWHLEEWKEAANLVRDQSFSKIYLYSGLIEGESTKELSEMDKSYLRSPLSYYNLPESFVVPTNPNLITTLFSSVDSDKAALVFLNVKRPGFDKTTEERFKGALNKVQMTPIKDSGLVKVYKLTH